MIDEWPRELRRTTMSRRGINVPWEGCIWVTLYACLGLFMWTSNFSQASVGFLIGAVIGQLLGKVLLG